MNDLKKLIFKELIYKIIDNKIDKFIATEDTFKNISIENFNIFLNALKLNKSIKMLKFSRITISQENFELLCKIIQYNKTINKLLITSFDLLFINANYLKSYDDLITNLETFISLNFLNENDKNNLQNKILDSISYNNSIYNMIVNNNNLKKLKLKINYNYRLINVLTINALCKSKTINHLSTWIDINYITLLLNNNKNITNLSLLLYLNSNNDLELNFKNFYNCIEQNTSLKKISFRAIKKNDIYKNKINFIIETLFESLIKNKSLETIKFKLFDTGFIIVNEKIRYELIIKLLQNNNRIKNLSIKSIKNRIYKELDDFETVNSFLKYLQTNNSLKKLKICSNNFNPRLLAFVIKNNKTLEYLDLLNSRIQNIDLMLEYLKTNTTLKYLNLKNIGIENKFYDKETINDAIKEVLKCNKNIKIDY